MTLEKSEIRKAILEIQNPYPEDDLIMSYRDFLKYREVLHLYQYNVALLCNMVDLIDRVWNTEARISRLSLVQVTKRYSGKAENRELPERTREQLFDLFRKVVIEDGLKLADSGKYDAKNALNSLLSGMRLAEDQQQFLCGHVEASNHVLNRVLRYPEPSAVISRWARDHFEDDRYRTRRAELVGWLLDEDPEFVVENGVLTADLEFMLQEDAQRIVTFEQDLDIYRAITRELAPGLESEGMFKIDRDLLVPDFVGYRNPLSAFAKDKPEFKAIRWNYLTGLSYDSKYDYSKPDIEKERAYFYAHREEVFCVTMAWGVAYCRLELSVKEGLLRRFFRQEVDYTFFKIGKRLKSVGLLEWLGEMKNEK